METRQKVEEEIRLKEMQHKLDIQKAEEQRKIEEMQHKLEIQGTELRIRELEAVVKSKPQVDVFPPDVLKPVNLAKLHAFIMTYHYADLKWRKLGATLGFTKQELDQIESKYQGSNVHVHPKELLRHWLHWYPGDSRGNTNFATYTQLRTALVNAGLGDVAHDLPSYQGLL